MIVASSKLESTAGVSVYVCNSVKTQLGIEGSTDPTYEELDAAVTATGYSGYVSLEYHIIKTEGSAQPEPEPEPEPEALKKSKPRR